MAGLCEARPDGENTTWRGMGLFCFPGVINPAGGLEGGAGEADFRTHHQTLKPPWESSSILMAYTARHLWLLGEDLFITLVYPSLSLKYGGDSTTRVEWDSE